MLWLVGDEEVLRPGVLLHNQVPGTSSAASTTTEGLATTERTRLQNGRFSTSHRLLLVPLLSLSIRQLGVNSQFSAAVLVLQGVATARFLFLSGAEEAVVEGYVREPAYQTKPACLTAVALRGGGSDNSLSAIN
eukprot:CAMPEP_0114480036 /NCGR_PEP_ID=MMETSP0104-20121206/16905_1 /TAXON_ID=37642 ORGANISM="Paraphysomonas imperforata, Strain PA2" /NCGR_SAMPLE_ID=MMETSP0104 /ASSEMBLY_ACC=CAM_ASM_000202 /LENGTH=133 /DNA_ID=CAMNT_0001655469 /DNA_START=314 /DNA_END=715 /DNA_ORIENTATION=+